MIEHFILELTELGDLVLDPFSEVGTTGVAARKHGRAAILLDISPATVFLTNNYLQRLSGNEMNLFDQAFQRISSKISAMMSDHQLYRTTCRQCDKEVSVRDFTTPKFIHTPAVKQICFSARESGKRYLLEKEAGLLTVIPVTENTRERR